MYELTIVGAGIHGCSIFLNLPPHLQRRTLLIDKNTHPLDVFYQRCHRLNMKYLRSPASHTLIDPPSGIIFNFANKHKIHATDDANSTSQKHIKMQNYNIRTSNSTHAHHTLDNFHGRYYTPSLNLFEQYTNYLLCTQSHLQHVQDFVVNLSRKNNIWTIQTARGEYQTRNIILALGNQFPHIPKELLLDKTPNYSSPQSTSKTLEKTMGKTPHNIISKKTTLSLQNHILNEEYVSHYHAHDKICIIGAGMTGSQLALRLMDTHAVTLLAGSTLKQSYFDSNPCYIGPKCRSSYNNMTIEEKLLVLKTARFPGTLNPYVYEKLTEAHSAHKLKIIFSKLETIEKTNNNESTNDEKRSNEMADNETSGNETTGNHNPTTTIDDKTLSNNRKTTHTNTSYHTNCKYKLYTQDKTMHFADHIIFATGLLSTAELMSKNPLLQSLVKDSAAPLTSSGIPLLAPNSLEWLPKLFVSGQLAELTLGPPAANIIGAQLFSRITKNYFAGL